jgi:Holliday junction resolvase RusA-like endonuclease
MIKVEFNVPGIPCAKAKKLAMRAGHATSYNDAKTENYQALVTNAAAAVFQGAPLGGPLVLRVVAVYPRLACQCQRSKKDGTLLGNWPEGRIPKDSKPDFDNLAKSICDGINASGLWEDDARICDGRVQKFHAAIGEAPHIEVLIREFVS